MEAGDEEGPTGVRGAHVEDTGDVDMVQDRQGLPFRLEAGDELPSVQARFNDFEGDFAADELLLHGREDDAEAALAI